MHVSVCGPRSRRRIVIGAAERRHKGYSWGVTPQALQFRPASAALKTNPTANAIGAPGLAVRAQLFTGPASIWHSPRANNELVAQHGGTPYIAFKVNAKPTEDGVYKRMFHYYNLKRDEFLSNYHKRSNVETTFSMVKAKFGDSLLSKTDTAMVNEALCKILCHNLCCLVQSAYELGVTATFWQTETPRSLQPDQGVDPLEAYAWV
jgi:hypothetical protein